MADKAARPQPVTLSKAWIIEGPEGPRLERFAKQSQQATSGDPMKSAGDDVGENGLESPPYDMDLLSDLLDSNSIHSRCVRQKATDTLGRGMTLRAKDDETGAQEEEDRWGDFLEVVESDGDGSFKERLTWAHQDFESVGWAVLEVGRGADGVIDGLWHVPAHTVRAHKDGRRFAQKRSDKYVWFKRFGLEGDVDAKRGGWSPGAIDPAVRGNEVIVLRNYTPRSSFYGLPDHIPALQALAGWTAQAEFNIRFFGNQAVPSYAVVVEGADLTSELEDLILDHFRRIKGDPARTIVIPVPSVPGVGESFQPKVRFERLSVEVKEASFRMYRQDAALEICISHGVPPYRVGWPIVGSLGGSTALEMTEIYNDSIVQPRQETWEQRLNRALLGAKGLDIKSWLLKAAELDVRNEERDLDKAKALYELGVTTPNDSARFFGYDERPDGVSGGKDYIASPLNPNAGTTGTEPEPAFGSPFGGQTDSLFMRAPMAQEVAKQWVAEVSEMHDLKKRIEEAVREPSLSVVGNGR